MPFLNSIINLFGTKSSRDFKKLSPFAEKINEKFQALENISNNQLRDKTQQFKKQINESTDLENKELRKLHQKINSKEFLSNPNDQIYYKYMLSYSPYDNVKKQDYPNVC